MTSYYSVGTVTLVTGSKTVSGNGTVWATALITGGNIIVEAAGNVLPIASVVDDDTITAELAWTGASGTYAYAIQRDTAYLKTLDVNSKTLAEMLAEIRQGTIFKYDVAGPGADRNIYDTKSKGFAYLATDGTNPQLYVKLSATSGDWAGPFAYGTGPQGEQGIAGPYTEIVAGTVTTLASGSAATVAARVVDADTVALDFGIPKGVDGTGTGDLVGPSGATDNRLAAFSGPTGKLVKDSGLLVSDVSAGIAGNVKFNASQSLSASHQGQARANIGVSTSRNKLLNGASRIIQRGTRSVAAGASAYVFDRFLVTNNTNQSVTVSRNYLGLNSGFAREARFTMRCAFASAPTSGTLRIEQRMEFVDSVKPGDHTFIAWMSGPAGTEALSAEFVQNFGTGGSPSPQVPTAMTFSGSSPTTIYSGSTNRRAWGVTVPPLSGKLLGSNANDYAATAIVMTPRQSGNYDLSWFSFVEGDATAELDPFSPRDPQQEEDSCMRFFELLQTDVYGSFDVNANYGSINWQFKARKRASPTLALSLGGAVQAAVGIDGVRATNAANSAPGILTGSTADAEIY